MAAVKPAKVAPGGPCGLHITVAAGGATSTIGLAGDWDLTEREAVSDAIAEVLKRRPERLVLDLSRLGFIDSSGIHGTIDAHQRCAAQGTGLVIVPGPRAVQRVFEICGLLGSLPFAVEDSPVRRADPAATSPRRPPTFSSAQRRRRSLDQTTDGPATRRTRN